MMAYLTVLQHDSLNWTVQQVVFKWWNKFYCFLVRMLTIDKLFINIKCNKPSLWFLLLQISETSAPNIMQTDEPWQIANSKEHKTELLGCLLLKSHYLYIKFLFWMQPLFFFLLSKVGEGQSLGMEGSSVRPLLCSSVYTFAHCEFIPSVEANQVKRGTGLYVFTHSVFHVTEFTRI